MYSCVNVISIFNGKGPLHEQSQKHIKAIPKIDFLPDALGVVPSGQTPPGIPHNIWPACTAETWYSGSQRTESPGTLTSQTLCHG